MTMCSAGNNRSQLRAFTLLEVIVVLSLSLALLGLSAGSLAERSPAPALVAAQQTVSALLTFARVEAMASGQTTRVLVALDHPEGGEPDQRLRSVQVVRRAADGRWHGVSRGVVLPRPALVVPATPPSCGCGAWLERRARVFVRGGRVADGGVGRREPLPPGGVC
jgi:hypothetical protein